MDYSWLILTRQLSQAEYDCDWGGVQEHWNAMRSRLIEEDEVWEYECSIDNRHPLSGTSGVAVKREGEIIDHIVTRRVLT